MTKTDDRYARKIVVRGLTPTDLGKLIEFNPGGDTAMLIKFEHGSENTWITYLTDDHKYVNAFDHMKAVTIYDR